MTLARTGRRILFVDDDPILRTVAEIAMQRAGHQVRACANVDEALEAVRGGGYDFALLDIRLGAGTDGFALATQLLALQPSLRIMMVSGTVEALHRDRARAMGLAGVFPKAQALGSLELLLPSRAEE